MIARIYEVTRSDQTLNVSVIWEDEALGFAEKRPLNFHTFDPAEITAEIIRIGKGFEAVLGAEDTIKQLLNLEIEIK